MPDERSPVSPRLLTELRTHALGLADDLTGALRRIVVRSGDTEIEVEWQQSEVVRTETGPVPLPTAAPTTLAEPVESLVEDLTSISSPMVGTFYRAPGPDAEPFVGVGDLVTSDQPIGVVEAMKLFNPIVAECSGEVVEILAKDAQPVEFGQQLMTVRAVESSDSPAN
ncbi:MAG TPA: biotin/lipoyl-containing protein [Pseudonocardiaceae bacterium]|jgi:acetyl-CoA carboxylase biotin carboxyl carrier protein|nr:biotin/lipoyl-containing protein [Pseudonocardiaceae bacterium]